MRVLRCLAVLSLLAVRCGAQDRLTPEQAHEEELFRRHQADVLRGPDSALGMVALNRIGSADVTLGSAAQDGIRMEHLPPHLLILHVEGDSLLLRPVSRFPTQLLADGHPPESGAVRFDADGTSARYTYGSASFVLRHKFGFFLVGRDTAAPALLSFHALHWYPVQATYRVTARWLPYASPRALRITNILGQVEDEQSAGVAEFELQGKTYRLEPLLRQGRSKPLFFIFRDASSRTKTYQAGRFLDAVLPSNGLSRPGTVVLDFNQARNPLCAFSEHTSCPLPPAQNRLPVVIASGEQRYHR